MRFDVFIPAIALKFIELSRFSVFAPQKSKNTHKITKIGGKQTNYAYSGAKSRGDAFPYPNRLQSSKIHRVMRNPKIGPKGGGKVYENIPVYRPTLEFRIICRDKFNIDRNI